MTDMMRNQSLFKLPRKNNIWSPIVKYAVNKIVFKKVFFSLAT